jgi:hypothetical protein
VAPTPAMAMNDSKWQAAFVNAIKP